MKKCNRPPTRCACAIIPTPLERSETINQVENTLALCGVGRNVIGHSNIAQLSTAKAVPKYSRDPALVRSSCHSSGRSPLQVVRHDPAKVNIARRTPRNLFHFFVAGTSLLSKSLNFQFSARQRPKFK